MVYGLPAPSIEAAFWPVFFIFALYKRNLYWNVTFWSFFATRLYIKAVSLYPRPRWPILLLWLLIRCFVPVVMVVWCLSLTPLHLKYSLMDAWTLYTYHSPHEPWEVLYDTGQSIDADVFAVHGLGSNPTSAWTYHSADGTSVRWLKDLLPYHEGFGAIRVTMLNHQTRWDSHTAAMSFEDHATKLLDEMEDIHEPGVPIIFISHSFGGLLLKKALILARHRASEIATSTKGILFLGVPHGGSQAAYWASLLSCTAYWRGSSPILLEYMSPTGSAIAELEKDFYNAYVKRIWRGTQTLPYVSDFIEMREERIGRLSLAPTVGIKSAGSHRHGDIAYLDADHRGLNKFGSASDPNFREFCRYFEIALSLAKGEAIGMRSIRREKISSPKAVSTVPFEQDKNFIGRKEVFSRLEAIYSRKDSHNRAALVGWGGIGKTQIAIEYSYRVRETNPDTWVFWLHAGHADLFTQAYIEIGSKVNLSLEKTDPDEKNMQHVYEWLQFQVHEPWLIILDNADDVDLFYQKKSPQNNTSGLINFLPRVSHGSILITSRDRISAFDLIGAPDNNHNIIDVMMMSEDDALALLKSRLPKSLFDEESAKELLSLLEYIPLAVTQACAYISRTPTASIAKYLVLVNNGNRVLKNEILDHRRYISASHAIFNTWAISFEQIRSQRPSSAEMLSLMSVLDRHGIPASLLVSYKGIQAQRRGLGDVVSELITAVRLQLLKVVNLEDQAHASLNYDMEVEEDLNILLGFSLITIDTSDGTYQMHRLVQRATEDWLTERHEISTWQDKAIELLASVYPEGFRDESYTSCRQLQVHADKVLSYRTRNPNILLDQSRLLYQSAWHIYKYTRNALDSFERVEKAISIRKGVYSEQSPPMQECLNLKALCLIDLGDSNEGEALLYKVMWTRARVWGFAHSSTLGSLDAIALILYNQKRFKEAESVRREILEVRRTKWPHSPYTEQAWEDLRCATKRLLQREFDNTEEPEAMAIDYTRHFDLSDEELELLILRELQYEHVRPGWLQDLRMPITEITLFLYERKKFSEVVALHETIIQQELYGSALQSVDPWLRNAPRNCPIALESFLLSLRELLLIDPDLLSPYSISTKYTLGYMYMVCNQHSKAIHLFEEYIAAVGDDMLQWRIKKRLEAARRISNEAKDPNDSEDSSSSGFLQPHVCTACKRSHKIIFYCPICDFGQCPHCTAQGIWCQNQSHAMNQTFQSYGQLRVQDDTISFRDREQEFSQPKKPKSNEQPNKFLDPRIEATYWIFWISFGVFWAIHHKKATQESTDRKLIGEKGEENPVVSRRHTD